MVYWAWTVRDKVPTTNCGQGQAVIDFIVKFTMSNDLGTTYELRHDLVDEAKHTTLACWLHVDGATTK